LRQNLETNKVFSPHDYLGVNLKELEIYLNSKLITPMNKQNAGK
jgi:hypothetical protein